MIVRRQVAACAIALAGTAAIARARAQTAPFPSGPLRLIVPSAPGGVADTIARLLGERAAVELGQPVVIENRAGASTIVGTQAAARSRPDGQTLLQVAAFGIVASVMAERVPYNLEADFAPILKAGSFPLVLAVSGASNLRSVADLVALAHATPGGITYGSGGTASIGHLAALRLVGEMGVPGIHVPYRGNNAAMQALIAGQVQFIFPATADAVELARAGTVRLLGVTAERRLALLPDVPTIQELGFPGFTPQIWYGYVVPAGTPPAALGRLREAYGRAVADPAIRDRLAALGFTTEPVADAAFTAFIQEEANRWRRVVRENNVTMND
jgi:tripartite-type tricarboxylate transporter receptor subunit TctC